MMPKRTLRAVEPGEGPSGPVTPATISEAVESGSARDVLASMRRALAQKLDGGEISSNAIASAYKELRELDRLIRSADLEVAAEEAQQDDEIRRRRRFNSAAL